MYSGSLYMYGSAGLRDAGQVRLGLALASALGVRLGEVLVERRSGRSLGGRGGGGGLELREEEGRDMGGVGN